ncbi:DUF1616 domain-containing protein [Chloroflexi bacterium TSY]|nr:DUF1616 domain-containing protein [Chloroflexi bacterium TSY]
MARSIYKLTLHQPDVLLVALLTLLQSTLIFLNYSGSIRVITGFLLISLLPGYALLAAALRPQKNSISPLEHIVLSIPVSLALSTTIGLIMNNLGVGISPKAHVLWMSGIILGLCTVAIVRNQHAVSHTDKIQYGIGFGAIIAATLILNIPVSQITAPPEIPIVSLYVLNNEGSIEDYPREVTVGMPIPVIIGGYYNGTEEQNYRLISSNHVEKMITLQPGKHWELPLEFTLDQPGVQSVSWSLYPVESDTPKRTVQLWLNAN